MRAKGFYSESHIYQALQRVSLYEEMNREHPGYFDMTICCGKYLFALGSPSHLASTLIFFRILDRLNLTEHLFVNPEQL